jgi:DNA-binding beta-propeller fold protein YncE
MRKPFLLLVIAAIFAPAAFASAPYRLLGEIPIGGEGGWDYLSIDPVARRLYLAQATRIVVIDLAQDKVVGEIAGTPGAHGFAIAHEQGRGFSSNGKEAKVSVVDLKTLKTLSKVATGENPDAVVFESGKKEVYAFNGAAKSATVIDAMSGEPVAAIPLPGKPEFAVSDPEAHRIYVNIEDRNSLVAIDTSTRQIAATWPLASCDNPTGLSIDLARHHLFVGCEKKLVLVETGGGKTLSTLSIGAGVDATAFDPATGLIFSSSGDGTAAIARELPGGKLELVQNLETRPGARTLALDPETHKIYLPAGKFAGPAPAKGHGRKIAPGSIRLFVYGP